MPSCCIDQFFRVVFCGRENDLRASISKPAEDVPPRLRIGEATLPKLETESEARPVKNPPELIREEAASQPRR